MYIKTVICSADLRKVAVVRAKAWKNSVAEMKPTGIEGREPPDIDKNECAVLELLLDQYEAIMQKNMRVKAKACTKSVAQLKL